MSEGPAMASMFSGTRVPKKQSKPPALGKRLPKSHLGTKETSLHHLAGLLFFIPGPIVLFHGFPASLILLQDNPRGPRCFSLPIPPSHLLVLIGGVENK